MNLAITTLHRLAVDYNLDTAWLVFRLLGQNVLEYGGPATDNHLSPVRLQTPALTFLARDVTIRTCAGGFDEHL
jgi:hypothetical protein